MRLDGERVKRGEKGDTDVVFEAREERHVVDEVLTEPSSGSCNLGHFDELGTGVVERLHGRFDGDPDEAFRALHINVGEGHGAQVERFEGWTTFGYLRINMSINDKVVLDVMRVVLVHVIDDSRDQMAVIACCLGHCGGCKLADGGCVVGRIGRGTKHWLAEHIEIAVLALCETIHYEINPAFEQREGWESDEVRSRLSGEKPVT